MKKLNYTEEMAKLFKQTKDHKIMPLATCVDNYPTARGMNVIIFNENIYFQTGINLLKYKQIVANNNRVVRKLQFVNNFLIKIAFL